jgi:hypothetical protein
MLMFLTCILEQRINSNIKCTYLVKSTSVNQSLNSPRVNVGLMLIRRLKLYAFLLRHEDCWILYVSAYEMKHAALVEFRAD